MRDFIFDLKDQRGRRDPNPGLLLHRYRWEKMTDEGGDTEEKQAILQATIDAAKNGEILALYRAAFERWSRSLPCDPTPIDLATTGRLITGLGSENVLEAGIRLHHIYGVPIIPGSALKGLAAHYCDQIWGERGVDTPSEKASRFRGARRAVEEKNQRAEPPGDYHQLLFGTTDDSGSIIFHDAWYIPGSSPDPLVRDVMTPHHQKWNDVKEPIAPTDFDSPIPVAFLSVSGTFRVAVSWHGQVSDKAKPWTELALSLLCDALKYWGVGGKTSSGYGRLAVPPTPPPPPPPKKRASGDKAKVTIVATRPKGGFEVQDIEPGRAPGSLTVGTPPLGTNTSLGAIVDVLVHVEDLKRPQYKWPQAPRK